MTRTDPAPTGTRSIETHQLLVVGRAGMRAERGVECTTRLRCVHVDECFACDSFAGVTRDLSGRHLRVLCRSTADAPRDALVDKQREPKVSAFMTREVVCVREDVALPLLVGALNEHAVSGLPVVDAKLRLIGVISKTDVVRAVGSPDHIPSLCVRDVMMRMPVTMSESAPISRAAALMAFEGVHRLPIVSDEGCIVGILSSLDVMRWVAHAHGYLMRPASVPPPRSTA